MGPVGWGWDWVSLLRVCVCVCERVFIEIQFLAGILSFKLTHPNGLAVSGHLSVCTFSHLVSCSCSSTVLRLLHTSLPPLRPFLISPSASSLSIPIRLRESSSSRLDPLFNLHQSEPYYPDASFTHSSLFPSHTPTPHEPIASDSSRSDHFSLPHMPVCLLRFLCLSPKFFCRMPSLDLSSLDFFCSSRYAFLLSHLPLLTAPFYF